MNIVLFASNPSFDYALTSWYNMQESSYSWGISAHIIEDFEVCYKLGIIYGQDLYKNRKTYNFISIGNIRITSYNSIMPNSQLG